MYPACLYTVDEGDRAIREGFARGAWAVNVKGKGRIFSSLPSLLPATERPHPELWSKNPSPCHTMRKVTLCPDDSNFYRN